MKTLSIALILFSLVACLPKTIAINPTAPRAVVVAESISNTARIATKVKKNTEAIATDIKTLKSESENGKNFAGQMKKSATITKEQLETNYKNWDSLNFKINFLEVATKSIAIDTSELEASALYGKKESNKLVIESKNSDKTIIALKDQATDEAGNVALGKMVKGIIYVLVGTLVIGSILYIITRFKLI